MSPIILNISFIEIALCFLLVISSLIFLTKDDSDNGLSSVILPSDNTITLFAYLFANSLSCVTTTTNLSLAISFSISKISSDVLLSKLPVGSSHKTILLSLAIALAIAIRCCCPPLRVSIFLSANSSNETNFKAFNALILTSSLFLHCSLHANFIFSITV